MPIYSCSCGKSSEESEDILMFYVEEKERRLWSQSVRRDMPRPSDVNTTVLRPANIDPPLTALQKVLLHTVHVKAKS